MKRDKKTAPPGIASTLNILLKRAGWQGTTLAREIATRGYFSPSLEQDENNSNMVQRWLSGRLMPSLSVLPYIASSFGEHFDMDIQEESSLLTRLERDLLYTIATRKSDRLVEELTACPDVLTPGEDEDALMRFYLQYGQDTMSRIMNLRREGIIALAHGDFDKQVLIGSSFRVMGNEIKSRHLINVGYFLQGEGFRFKGQRKTAREMYSEALEWDPHSVRTLRSLAIMHEQEESPEAGPYYDRARILLEAWELQITSPEYAFQEWTRVHRHFGNYLSNRSKKSDCYDFETYLDRVERSMPRLKTKSSPYWILDRFKTEVFLGQMHSSINNTDFATRNFAQSFHTRGVLIAGQEQLSSGDEEGFKWLDSAMYKHRDVVKSRSRRITQALTDLLNDQSPSQRTHIMTWMGQFAVGMVNQREIS